MNWWQRFRRREEMDRQLDKELSFHLDSHIEELIAQGVNPAEARRRARVAFGGPLQVAEECCDVRGTRWLEDLLHDLRYALRTLRLRPGFAAVALMTLALGTGATTVMFAMIQGVLLDPLPYGESDRLFSMLESTERYGLGEGFVYLNFRDLQRDARTVELAAQRYGGGMVVAPGRAAYVDGLQITAGTFEMLRVPLARGREFTAAEDRPGGDLVAIVSYDVWRERFGGKEDAIGSVIDFDGRRYTVIGVAPKGFELAGPMGIYTPLGQNQAPYMQFREGRAVRVMGRIAEGADFASANVELDGLARRLAREYPEANAGSRFFARPLLDQVVAPVASTLWILLGAVGLVLLIACTNIASLLLARAVSRQRELAMRVALGAGRGRLIRQCLTESALLGLVGGGLGILVAWAGMKPFLALWPGVLPRAEQVDLDGRALGLPLLFSVLCGLLFGIAPALRAPSRDLEQTLRGGSRSIAGGSRRLHGVFVASEVALAVVLLVSAGMLGRTLLRLASLESGLRLDHVLTVRVAIPPGVLNDPARIRATWDDVLASARSTPGITAAALTDIVPMRRGENALPYSTAPNEPAAASQTALASGVTPDYLAVMGIPLLHGRFLSEQDRLDTAPVVVIDEVMARHAFGRTDVAGERLWIPALGPSPVEVVGVAGHVRHWGIADDDTSTIRDQLYYPFAQLPDNLMRSFASFMSMTVRTAGDPLAMIDPLQRELGRAAGDQVIYAPNSLEQLAGASIARQRFLLLLFGVFAGLALLLACIGVYGVLAYLNSQRVSEFGVRIALGASARQVIGLVLGDSLSMVGVGVVIGIAASYAAARQLANTVAGVEPANLATFAAMTGVLLLAAILASLGPAIRASRVDAIVALRRE